MKPSDLSIIDVLDFQPDRGLVELENRRVLIFDGNILMELRRMIVENLGCNFSLRVSNGRYGCKKPGANVQMGEQGRVVSSRRDDANPAGLL